MAGGLVYCRGCLRGRCSLLQECVNTNRRWVLGRMEESDHVLDASLRSVSTLVVKTGDARCARSEPLSFLTRDYWPL